MNFFTNHLDSVQESYWTHFKFGIWAAVVCVFLGAISLIHAVFPFLFPGVPERVYKYFKDSSAGRLERIESLRQQSK